MDRKNKQASQNTQSFFGALAPLVEQHEGHPACNSLTPATMKGSSFEELWSDGLNVLRSLDLGLNKNRK